MATSLEQQEHSWTPPGWSFSTSSATLGARGWQPSSTMATSLQQPTLPSATRPASPAPLQGQEAQQLSPQLASLLQGLREEQEGDDDDLLLAGFVEQPPAESPSVALARFTPARSTPDAVARRDAGPVARPEPIAPGLDRLGGILPWLVLGLVLLGLVLLGLVLLGAVLGV